MSADFLSFAVDLAERAGKLLSEGFGNLASLSVDFKSRRDPVTEIDLASERLIVDAIREAYPEHRILTEEAGDLPGDEHVWIVDPLDGTVNFIHGHPFYAVSIGLLVQGRMEVGAVCAPELGAIFTAARGRGTQRNGRPVSVSDSRELLDSVLATGFAYNRNQKEHTNVENFARLVLRAQGIRRCGAAAIDLAFVAAGILDGFWELYLAPWDVAAGALLVEEGGGRVSE